MANQTETQRVEQSTQNTIASYAIPTVKALAYGAAGVAFSAACVFYGGALAATVAEIAAPHVIPAATTYGAVLNTAINYGVIYPARKHLVAQAYNLGGPAMKVAAPVIGSAVAVGANAAINGVSNFVGHLWNSKTVQPAQTKDAKQAPTLPAIEVSLLDTTPVAAAAA